MINPSTKEGKVSLPIPSIDKPCFTYYKIFGDLSSPDSKTPLVVAHGGPGRGHSYLLPFSQLWTRYSIPVVFYDEIGCGESTHLPDTKGDEGLWTESLFTRELGNLVDKLGLSDRDGGYDLLGQSWGGMFAAAFASERPRGLRRLVLASGAASKGLWHEGVEKVLIPQMPREAQEAIKEALKEGRFDGEEYKGALDLFMRMFMCRYEPYPPPEMKKALECMRGATEVNETMIGPSPFTHAGSLRTWSVIDRLPLIKAKTLMYNGEFDTHQESTTKPLFDLIPDVKWVKFAGAGHMAHCETVENRERCLVLVGEFLTE